jgi:DNA-binding GntR family transcriptional regulator
MSTAPRTLADSVYDELRRAIALGAYAPNERLVELDVARWLKVSRTPVREALQRLANDGMVVAGRHGWVVRQHTIGEIVELYQVRIALEGYACRLAALHATDADKEAIQDAHQYDAEDLTAGPRSRVVQANEAFHQAVIRACHNSHLVNEVKRTREFSFNLGVARLYANEELVAALKGHQTIMDAIMSGDAEAAEQAGREHVEEALDVLLQHWG